MRIGLALPSKRNCINVPHNVILNYMLCIRDIPKTKKSVGAKKKVKVKIILVR